MDDGYAQCGVGGTASERVDMAGAKKSAGHTHADTQRWLALWGGLGLSRVELRSSGRSVASWQSATECSGWSDKV